MVATNLNRQLIETCTGSGTVYKQTVLDLQDKTAVHTQVDLKYSTEPKPQPKKPGLETEQNQLLS